MDRYTHLSKEELISRLEKIEKEKGDWIAGEEKHQKLSWENVANLRKVTADILTLLLNADAGEMIDQALGRVLSFFGADRAYIHLYDWEKGTGCLAYQVMHDRLFTIQEELQDTPVERFPWWCERIVQGEDIVIPSVSRMPEEAAAEKERFEFRRAVSVIVVPLFLNGRIVASLGLDTIRMCRNWTSLERENLHMLGDMIAIAIDRRQSMEKIVASEKLLRAGEDKYRLKAEQAEALLAKLKFVIGTGDSLLWEYDVQADRLQVQLELVGDAVSPGHISSLRLEPFCTKSDFRRAIYPADRQRVFDDHFERLLRGEIDHYAISYRRLSQNGYIWVNATVHTYKWTDDGKPAKVVYYLTNINEQVIRQKKIDSLNTLMGVILHNVPVMIMVKDIEDDFRYMYFNTAAELFTELKAADCIGKTDYEIYTDTEFARSVCELDRLAVEKGEYSCYAADCEPVPGKKRIINAVRLVIDDFSDNFTKRPLLLTLLWDITERRASEVALIKAQESDKLKSAFLANMSHEIRTPLNAIVGFSGILAETDDPEEKREFIGIIRKNNELLLQLINDILDFSTIESGQLNYTFDFADMKEICLEACRVHSLRMNSGVRLIFDAEHLPSLSLYTDSRRVMQVISNFLNNAVKFTAQGSITLSYRLTGREVYVAVTDTGIGIPAGQRENIFHRFVKLDTFTQGTGLGLAICKMTVEGLGGVIGVESEPGRGSTFWFTLPLDRKQSSPELPGASAAGKEDKPENAAW